MNDQLEDDYREPYTAWKAAQTPETNAAMLTALKPTIEGAIRTHVGQANPLLASRAKVMALEGLASYDPARGRLQTHLYNHLQGLKRANRQQTTILKVPERISLDRYQLQQMEDSLRAQLGREPTDIELADHTGFSPRRMARVRSYDPAVSEGMMADQETGGGFAGAVIAPHVQREQLWRDIVYDELDDYHRRIMELAMGYGGRKPLPNHVIASRMQRSPGAISQAKARIQQRLDEMYDLEGIL